MSRIGRKPITVPTGVDLAIDGQTVRVKGPKGELSHTVAEPIKVSKADDGSLVVERPDDERRSKALHGLSRTLIDVGILSDPFAYVVLAMAGGIDLVLLYEFFQKRRRGEVVST